MTRRIAVLLLAMLVLAGCTSSGPVAHDPGRVVLPVKQVPVPGRLYATKGRALYRFSGTDLTRLRFGSRVKDPAVTSAASRAMIRGMTATSVLVPVEEYLATSYRPDREYVDGAVVERRLRQEDALQQIVGQDRVEADAALDVGA